MQPVTTTRSDRMTFKNSIPSKATHKSNGVADHKRYNEEILITPDLAREYLAKNTTGNRQQRERKIAIFASDMLEGRWKRHTAETIKFNTKGIVVDGQHRLRAVIKANTSVWFECAFNIPDENFDVLDSGTARSFGDAFRISGVKNNNLVAAIIQQFNVLVHGGPFVDNAGKSKMLTSAGLLQRYHTNENYWDNVTKLAGTWYQCFGRILRPSLIGGLFAYFETLDATKAFNFWEQLCKPINADHHGISLLKNKLMQDKLSLRKMTQAHRFALIIKAWNAYRLGVECKRLSFDPSKENMPVIK